MKGFMIPAILLLAASLSGCQPEPDPLRIVSSPWPGYEPLYLARDLGYLNERQVVLNELPSSNITLESFSNGSADVATLTLDETITLLAQGKKVRILAIMDISNGADAVMAAPHVRKLADLKGRRIAITNIPLGVYMLSRTLDAARLKPQDVTVIPMPEDKHEFAYLQKQIDVAVTFEPFKTKLKQAGAHTIFDSSQIPNEIFDLLLVSEDVYQIRRTELCELTRQWFRTLKYVQDHVQETHALMSRRLGMDQALYQNMMDGLVVPSRQENQRLLAGDAPALLQPARRLSQAMLDARLIHVPVDPAAALATDFLPSCLAK